MIFYNRSRFNLKSLYLFKYYNAKLSIILVYIRSWLAIMLVKYLHIRRFRHIENVSMEFGKRITAIAGQNGTGKSSLLGLVGHTFGYSKDENSNFKTLSNIPFETKYSEIFQFSYPMFDKPQEHDYEVELSDGTNIPVLSYDRIEKGKPKSLRLRVGKSEKDGGKIQLPVIYLGLKRLFPLAQEVNIRYNPDLILTSEEAKSYQEFHNEVLLLDEGVTPEYIEVMNKKFYGVKTTKYDSLGNSAGQDNVGQIVTALLSFKRLRENIGDRYNGGILLIDEIDATLYPAAQKKLIEKLFRWSQDLNLQVIFTTHSLEILELLCEKYPLSNDSKIIYLSKANGGVQNVQNEISIMEVINDLRVQVLSRPKPEKICVFCEDNEAQLLTKYLLDKSISRNLVFQRKCFGAGELLNLARNKLPQFKRCIFVLDGDQRKKVNRRMSNQVVFLPGNERPENIFYKYLKSIDPSDDFWGKTGGYTKQVCFRDCVQISNDRVTMKKWFNNQKPHLGKAYSKLFSRWKADNLDAVSAFNGDFSKLVGIIEKYS